MEEHVILVDETDCAIGSQEKLAAHKKGLLHRAFSIFIFNTQGELLLQKRAASKYHSAGLWANTCCSHPSPGEDVLAAAHRRLKEEMGFDCDLKPVGHLLYKTAFDNGLTEHEFDHLFVGVYAGEITSDIHEVEEWKWISTEELVTDIKHEPERYSYWLQNSLKDVLARR